MFSVVLISFDFFAVLTDEEIELFGDTQSSETSKSDIKSTKENLDEIIEDMNREIKVINEKKINLSDNIINE